MLPVSTGGLALLVGIGRFWTPVITKSCSDRLHLQATGCHHGGTPFCLVAPILLILALVVSSCTPLALTSPTPSPGANIESKATATGRPTRAFQRIFIIILENKSRESVLSNPYFKGLAERGVQLTNYRGVSHPSQPNYIAMTAGEPFVSDDSVHNLPQSNLVDLLEDAQIAWRAYEGNYPGQCFAGAQAGDTASGRYVRKHNPFVSFDDVRNNPQRCSKIVNADRLSADIAGGQLPAVSFYVPNENADMHDQPLAYGADWLKSFLEPKLMDPRFTDNTLIVITFDETNSDLSDPAADHLYAVLIGPLVRAGTTDSTQYNHYSILRTI